ncbi:TonB-dependent receptor [[Pseudomonas] boreopolis]
MLNHKRSALSIALAVALTPTLAMAQSATTSADTTASEQQAKAEEAANPPADGAIKQLDSVTVTGIRRAIEASIITKQAENTIVEAISAEDIGKLPDASIADSLARLPGLTAQRYGGRPQEINIRGFAGDFSTALLNGREQVSFGNNRGVEFDQYPSELMSQVVVHKTTSAELVGQGLSGTVNMKTVRPLDYGERAVAINVRGDMNRLGDLKDYGNRLSASYIDQFADDTWGVVLGLAHMDSPGQSKQYESWGYSNGIIGGGNAYRSEIDNKRDGVMATVQFKPNDRFESTLDLFYSEFKRKESKWGLQYGLAYGSGSTLESAEYQNGTTVSSQWSNISPVVVRNDYNETDDKLISVGWNNKVSINAHWTATADVSYSRAKRDETLLESYAGLAGDASDSGTFTYNSNGWYDSYLGADYGDASNLTFYDPGSWGGARAQAGYLKYFQVKDTLSAVRLDLSRSFDSGFISNLQFGANLTDRSKSRASTEYTLCTTAACTDNVEMAVPTPYVKGTDFNFAGISRVLRLDVLGMLNDGVYYLVGKDDPDISNKNWQVDEQVATAYAQLNLDGDLGPVSVKGNVGIQAVNVDQESEGVATFDGVALGDSNTQGTSYTNYLPSMNLSFGFPHEQVLRLGASRQMARPRMDQMAGNAVFSYDQTKQKWTGSGGNPNLKPWLADAYDLSYEKYFAGDKGYFSAAYFFKDLKTYIYSQTVQYDFSQLPISAETLASYSSSTIGEYTQPVNGEGGKIRGYELALSVPLDILWSPLEGFGIVANYSDTTSEIHPDGPGTTQPLPGLSKYVSSITAYYERHGFSARISSRHRSQFLGEVQGYGGDREQVMFGKETVTDLQLGYTFQSGRLANLSLLLQVNNLENEPFRSNNDSLNERVNKYYEYGRTYLLGANYRF